MNISEKINWKIAVGETKEEVTNSLNNIFVDFSSEEDTIETERLDHIDNSECKVIIFNFENDILIDIDEVF